MYPKNAAAPEPIAIGAVIQISDGAVQTSGCTVRIKPIGVAEADGGGTTAYSTDGIVLYTPTQAETNYTSFVLIAKKTACIPVSVTVVTTASVTPGKVVLSGETHTAAVIPTVTTVTTTTNLTNLPAITAGWLTAAGIAASALDGKGNWNIGKTGYTLTATTGLGNQTADITGTITTATNVTSLNGLAANTITAAAIAADAVTELQSGLSTLTAAGVRTAIGMAAANLDTQIGLLATAANLLIVSDGVGFITSVLMGACSDAGTAAETYTITFGGSTYTVDYTGLDTTGNRTATTRTKT